MDGNGVFLNEVAQVDDVYVSSHGDHVGLDSGESCPRVLNFLADVMLPLKLSLVIADLG